MTMIQPAYLNANNDSIKGIAVNDNNPNIRIEGVSYYAPDFKTPTVSNGPLGLTSTGPSTYVNGMLVIGKPGPWANIGIAHGSVRIALRRLSTAARTAPTPRQRCRRSSGATGK